MRSFTLVLFRIGLALYCPLAAGAEVMLVRQAATEIQAPEIRNALEKAKIPILAEKEAALPPQTRAKIADALKKIILPKDGNGPFYLVFADDLSVNAHFVAPSGTDARAVVVNLGLLDFLKTDDELVAILGHELEHGTSELQSHVDELAKAPRSRRMNALDSAYLTSLQKSVESEVDIKSVINRVQPNGYNVEAAGQVLDRLTETFGDGINSTHNMSQSRRNHLDLATTLLSRRGGMELNRLSNRNAILDGSIGKSIRDRAFVEQRKARALRSFREPLTELEELLTRFKEGKLPSDGAAKELERTFQKAVEKRLQSASELLGGIITPAEELQLELRANAEAHELLQAARQKILGPSYVPRGYAEAQFLSALSAPRTLSRLDSWEGSLKIVSLLGQIAQDEQELSQLNRSQNHRSESRALELQAKIKRAKDQYNLLSTAYPGDDAKGILDAISRLAQEYERLDSIGDFKGTGRVRAQLIQTATTLRPYTAIIGGLEKRRAELAATQAQRTLPHLQDFLTKNEPIYELANSIGALPPEQKAKFAQNFLDQLVDSFQAAFSRERSATKQALILKRMAELLDEVSRRDTGILEKSTDVDINAVPIRKIVDSVIAHSRGPEALDALGLHKPAGDPTRGQLQSTVEGLQWTKALGSAVFDTDRLRKFHQTAESLALQRLNQAAKAGTLSQDGLRIIDRLFNGYYGAMSLMGDKADYAVIRATIDKLSKFHAIIRPAADPRLTPEESRQLFKDLLTTRALVFTYPSEESQEESKAIARRLLDRPMKASAQARFIEVEDLARLAKLAERSERDAFQFVIDNPQWVRRSWGWPISSQKDADRLVQFREEFLRHVLEKQPEKSRIAYQIMLGYNDAVPRVSLPDLRREKEEIVNSAAIRRYASLRRGLPRDPTSEQYLRLFRKWFQEVGTDQGPMSTLASSSQSESSLLQRVRWAKAIYLARAEESARQRSLRGGRASTSLPKEGDTIFYNLLKESHLLHPYERMVTELPVQDQLDLLKLNIRADEKSAKGDQLFEAIWENAKRSETGKKLLLDPDLMDLLYFNDTKKRFAEWTLEARFGVSELAASLRNKKAAPPLVQQTRPVVPELRAWMDRLLPEKSLIKDEILESIESRLMTSQAEHAELAKSRLSTQDWFKSREIAYSDLPQALSERFKSAFDRHQYLEYLLDIRKALPDSIEELRGQHSGVFFEQTVNAANASKRAFATASQAGRVLMLQPLLSAKNGSLSDPKLVEQVNRLILGDRTTDPLVQSIYRAYLDSVPEGEKKILLSAVLSTLAENSGKKGASVKAILESMGPFGIKAGQFLRTSGLASRELSKELDDFLDHALAPVREQIYEDLKKAFGPDLKIVSSVGDLAGSGSVNYVVVADLKNPQTGKTERVTVRFQRDAVEGMARNENEIWGKATALLKQRGDPQTALLARRLDEARLNAMETLKKGGVELDLSIERNNYEKARLTYSASGVDVARPLEHFQKLVPPDLQSTVSIYEYIENTPLKSISDPKVLTKVHRRIMNVELTALKNGVFDPDGHDGNWLYHPETDRLVRIDYAQLREPSRQEHEAFKELMRSLLLDGNGPSGARAIANTLPQTFEFSGTQPSLDLLTEHLARILRDPDLPPQNAPHDRVFFIRDALEKALGGPEKGIEIRFRDATRSALASLSRIVPHSQHLPANEFRQAFVQLIELTPKRAAIGMARAKIDDLRRTLTDKCQSFFSRFVNR